MRIKIDIIINTELPRRTELFKNREKTTKSFVVSWKLYDTKRIRCSYSSKAKANYSRYVGI